MCSRRKAEQYLTEGLVTVNGKVAKLGQKADAEKDKIKVDGKVIEERKEMCYFLMNKPGGVVTENISRASASKSKKAHSLSVSPSVRDLLPQKLQGKIFPVGRLDKDTSGLLLFTNDGVLAYHLTHPKFLPRKGIYRKKPKSRLPMERSISLKPGSKFWGEKTKPAKVKRLTGRSFSIALTEGKNRQIRRMCQKVGSPVKDLKRVRIATLTDSKLKEGKVRELTDKERGALLKAVGI